MRLQYRGIDDEQAASVSVRERARRQRQAIRHQSRHGSLWLVAATSRLWVWGVTSRCDIYEKWRHALAHLHRAGDRQQRAGARRGVTAASRLKEFPVTRLPSPVEEPGFSCGIRVTAPFITERSRVRRAQCRHVQRPLSRRSQSDRRHRARRTTRMLYHHPSAVRRKEAACRWRSCLAVCPILLYVSAANLPYGVDEIAVAGGIRRRPVDMVPCKTIPLEVPADAEIVIEGEISLDRHGARRAVQRLSRVSNGRARIAAGDRYQSDHPRGATPSSRRSWSACRRASPTASRAPAAR